MEQGYQQDRAESTHGATGRHHQLAAGTGFAHRPNRFGPGGRLHLHRLPGNQSGQHERQPGGQCQQRLPQRYQRGQRRPTFCLYAFECVPSLHYIADPDYINGVSHKFLVDGQVGVFDMQLNSAWKTLALGGVGAGGKTFYAVQLFDASAGNVFNALWEISAPTTANTANVFNDLGYAYTRPEVARLADGRWVAFISNGYGSNSGVAALYVVDVRDGSLIKKIVIDSTETTNGLSSVKLKVNSQNVVQAAYGGDLKGRMWKFDLSGATTDTWGVAFSGKPLFTTPGGTTQPITAQPLLADNSLGGKEVFFGTGKFNETTDKTSKDLQAFYAVWDANGGAGQLTVSSLQAQAVTGVTTSSTGGQFITTTQNETTYPAE